MAKTIYDVAQEAGVSVSTVSRAMNQSGYVSEETRRKIEKAMKGYQPNAAAQRLVTKVSNTIGVVSAMTSQYFFVESNYARTMAGIAACADALHYRIMLDIGGDGRECVRLHKMKIVDGIILIDPGYDDKLISYIMANGVPVVLLGSPHKNLPGLTRVDVDRVGGFYDGVSYLLSLGHRKIAMINGSTKRTPSINKQIGFEKAMRERGVSIRPEYMRQCEEKDVIASSYALTKELLQMEDRPTAIVAYADISAMGAYQAAKELNIRIPEDLSIIGFDNSDCSQYCDPKLTTIAQPIYDKGYQSVQHLVDLLRQPKREGLSTMLSCYPVIRDSTCPPPK